MAELMQIDTEEGLTREDMIDGDPALNEVEKSSTWKERRCPRLLRMTSGAMQATAAFMGISLGVAIALAIYLAAPPTSLPGRLFDLQRIQGVLPMVILVMFFWGVIQCLFRSMRMRSLRKVASRMVVSDLLDDLKTMDSDELLSQLEMAPVADASPLLRRVRVVLRHWLSKPCLLDSVSLLNQQADIDEEDIQHAYGTIKTFIWALPVLGLIGTVVGIALSVGDFGGLVGGNVEDVKAIKTSLIQVTAGLSFAFTTTLIGLLGALFLVLPSSALQAREEKLITKAATLVSDSVLPALQTLFPESPAGTLISESDQLRDALVLIAEEVVEKAGAATHKVLEEAEKRFAVWHQDAVSVSQQASIGFSASTKTLGAELSKATREFLKRLEMVRDAMDRQLAGFKDGIDRNTASMAEGTRRLDSAMEKHNKAATDATGLLENLMGLSKELSGTQDTLLTAMNHMTNGDTAKSLKAVAQIMTDTAKQTTDTRRSIVDMAEATRRVTACQMSIQENLKQFESMGLTGTLNDLGQTLRNVSGVLQNFQEPIIFKAVPASSIKSAPAAANVQHMMPAPPQA